MLPYEILAHKRSGGSLSDEEIERVVAGAADGSFGDAELGAFLMAIATRGADARETRVLTRSMLDSGESWNLAESYPNLADKHSTGGVGDKTSLILTPLLAACGVPVVMLTGRALGHTGGTADKLDVIPGFRQELDRARTIRLLDAVQAAVGIATGVIAPADRRLYALRNRTGTVESLPLITASILSKKLATGAAGIVFDVKSGNGAFLPEVEDGIALAKNLVEVSRGLGRRAAVLLSDMSQPLGRWAGHSCEVRESLDVLEGGGPADLRDLTLALAAAVTSLVQPAVDRSRLERALDDGTARVHFDRWAQAQGADPMWLADPRLPIAPVEVVVTAEHAGQLLRIDTRRLGFLLAEQGTRDGAIDPGVSLRMEARLGDVVRPGTPLARLYLGAGAANSGIDAARRGLSSCFEFLSSDSNDLSPRPSQSQAAAPALYRRLEL